MGDRGESAPLKADKYLWERRDRAGQPGTGKKISTFCCNGLVYLHLLNMFKEFLSHQDYKCGLQT